MTALLLLLLARLNAPGPDRRRHRPRRLAQRILPVGPQPAAGSSSTGIDLHRRQAPQSYNPVLRCQAAKGIPESTAGVTDTRYR
jgi:hypothetical protein